MATLCVTGPVWGGALFVVLHHAHHGRYVDPMKCGCPCCSASLAECAQALSTRVASGVVGFGSHVHHTSIAC